MVTDKPRRGTVALFVAAVLFFFGAVLFGLFVRFHHHYCWRADFAAKRQAAADFNCDLGDIGGGWVSGGCSLHSVCGCGRRVVYGCEPRAWQWRGHVLVLFGYDCRQQSAAVADPHCR